jgi:hypothetical protein
MTTSQENKLSMYQMVERYLSAGTAVVAALPNYTTSFAAFQACLRRIQDHRQAQATNKGGLAEQKQQRRDALVALAVDVISKVKAYATFHKQTVLLREIDYTPSDLKTIAASVLVDCTRIIHRNAQANLKALAEYRVTKELLGELQKAIAAFEASITEPRMGTVARKNATDALQEGFGQADRLLREELDVILGMVRGSDPAFFTGYRNARVIVARKGGRGAAAKEEQPRPAAERVR